MPAVGLAGPAVRNVRLRSQRVVVWRELAISEAGVDDNKRTDVGDSNDCVSGVDSSPPPHTLPPPPHWQEVTWVDVSVLVSPLFATKYVSQGSNGVRCEGRITRFNRLAASDASGRDRWIVAKLSLLTERCKGGSVVSPPTTPTTPTQTFQTFQSTAVEKASCCSSSNNVVQQMLQREQ